MTAPMRQAKNRPPEPSGSGFGSRKIRGLVLFLTIAYLVWLPAAYLGVPPLAERLLVETLRERAGLEASVDSLRFDPFRIALTVSGLAIVDRPGSLLLSVEEIYANAQVSSVLRWAPTLAELRVVDSHLALRRFADRQVNFVDEGYEVPPICT